MYVLKDGAMKSTWDLSGTHSSLVEVLIHLSVRAFMIGARPIQPSRILSPVEAYNLYDRLGRRILHEERFSIPRIPAVVELCIQAGVEIPDFPMKRRRKPIIRIGKKEFVDADESELPDPEPPEMPLLAEISDSEAVAPSTDEEKLLLAEETLQAWDKMRRGAKRLMKMYPVRVCGVGIARRSMWALRGTRPKIVEPTNINRGMASMIGKRHCLMI